MKEISILSECFLEGEEIWGQGRMLLLGPISDVLKDVLIEDLFSDFYCKIVIHFSPFPGYELISVKVLCTNKICNSVS